MIEGTAGGVDGFVNKRIYVFVYPVMPPGAGWYLQKSPANIGLKGDWTQSPSYIGSDVAPAVTGNTLKIRAVLVTKDATYDGEKLDDLADSDKLVVLTVIEDIEGIITLSDPVDLIVSR